MRTQAEEAVKQISEADPATFFVELSKELRNDAAEDRVRQQAGLIMKIYLDATVCSAHDGTRCVAPPKRARAPAPPRSEPFRRRRRFRRRRLTPCQRYADACSPAPSRPPRSQEEALKAHRRARWLSINPETRKVIKDNVANSIFARTPLARLVTPQVIAKIGAIEIQPGHDELGAPRNQWPDLVMGLVMTAARADLDEGPREASLRGLGFLLEALDEYDESPLLQNEVDAALNSITNCMAQAGAASVSVSVQRAATSALYDALPFVAQNFEDEHRAERNAIMMAVCTATQVDDAAVKLGAFQCISRIAELYYDFLEDYMKVLAELTATAARSKDEKIAIVALDFWAQIAEEEEDRRKDGTAAESKDFTLKALKPLVEMVFEIMATNKANEEDAEYGIVDSSQAVLQKTARAVGHPVVDVIMPFINANFASPDPLRRDAAVSSFGLILEGPDKARLQKEIILPALPHLLAKLEGATRDPEAVVRSSAAFALKMVFQEHLEVLAGADGRYEHFDQLVRLLCRALEDVPVVVKHTAGALNDLIKGMHDDVPAFEFKDPATGVGKSLLSPLFYHVINALMSRADKPDWYEQELRVDCYLCITTVIEAASESDEVVLLAFLANCLQRLEASCVKTNAGVGGAAPAAPLSQEERQHEVTLQEKLCSMINEMMLQVEDKASGAADHVAQVMVRIVQAKTGAEAEAIQCLATLGLVVRETYERYMPSVYPLLLAAMQNTDDHVTAKFAIMAISDVARALSARFEVVAGQVVDQLKIILMDQEVMRSLKPPALAAFADIAIALGPRIEDYMVNMLNIIKSAAKTDIPPDDEDLEEYLTEVRKAAISAWSGLFLAFCPEPDVDSAEVRQAKAVGAVRCLEPSLPDLREVIRKWASEWSSAEAAAKEAGSSWEPDFSLLQDSVQILGDASQALPHRNVEPYLNQRVPEIIWLCRLEVKMNAEEYPEDEPLAAYASKFLPP